MVAKVSDDMAQRFCACMTNATNSLWMVTTYFDVHWYCTCLLLEHQHSITTRSTERCWNLLRVIFKYLKTSAFWPIFFSVSALWKVSYPVQIKTVGQKSRSRVCKNENTEHAHPCNSCMNIFKDVPPIFSYLAPSNSQHLHISTFYEPP